MSNWLLDSIRTHRNTEPNENGVIELNKVDENATTYSNENIEPPSVETMQAAMNGLGGVGGALGGVLGGLGEMRITQRLMERAMGVPMEQVERARNLFVMTGRQMGRSSLQRTVEDALFNNVHRAADQAEEAPQGGSFAPTSPPNHDEIVEDEVDVFNRVRVVRDAEGLLGNEGYRAAVDRLASDRHRTLTEQHNRLVNAAIYGSISEEDVAELDAARDRQFAEYVEDVLNMSKPEYDPTAPEDMKIDYVQGPKAIGKTTNAQVTSFIPILSGDDSE